MTAALIFLKRALPITKPDALLFEDDFLGARVNHSGVYSLTRGCPILRGLSGNIPLGHSMTGSDLLRHHPSGTPAKRNISGARADIRRAVVGLGAGRVI